MAEQNINGIIIDLNRISRREFRNWTKRLNGTEDGEEKDALTGELVQSIVTRWPFGDVSSDAYMDLGLGDSQMVDAAILSAMNEFGEKK